MSVHKNTKPVWGEANTIESGESSYLTVNEIHTGLGKPTLLLHSCCGPCSTAVLWQVAADYQVTVFFYNPNITDEEEYNKRKESQLLLIQMLNEDPDFPHHIDYKEGPFDRQRFIEDAAGYSNEPEGGARCNQCFRMRLQKTAEMAMQLDYDFFGTTLSVSPHKDFDVISHLGRKLAMTYGVSFLDKNFKKNGGYQQSIALSKKYGLYRQSYCGCSYSNPNDENKKNIE